MLERQVVVEQEQRSISGVLLAVVAVALLAAIGGLAWCYNLSNQLKTANDRLAAADTRSAALEQKLGVTDARLRATTETLGQSVGMTQRQIESKTQTILAAQQKTVAEQEKLAAEQAATNQKVTAVSSDVATVKTDVGGVKTDVATTRNDLEQTKSQLQRTIGDAGVMSGLIAKNHDEVEILKHKGDRNIYEFNLQRGAPATLLGTVKIQLKKVDNKHSRYTLNVSSDDRNIEKKDKGIDEPVQFYSGKDPLLFEIVVNQMDKNTVRGYLSTPKNAPQPISAQ